jgi:hypothetical protein
VAAPQEIEATNLAGWSHFSAIEPDVRISRIRLSDWLHLEAIHGSSISEIERILWPFHAGGG